MNPSHTHISHTVRGSWCHFTAMNPSRTHTHTPPTLYVVCDVTLLQWTHHTHTHIHISHALRGSWRHFIALNPSHTHTSPMLCMLRDVTLVMNTLVMLSGLSPSGLGGPRSCSPSPFSKLYKKAGFKICCRTYKKILKWRRRKTKPGSLSLTRQNQLGHAAASGQNSVRGAASNFVFPSSGNCKGRVTTWGKEQTRSLFSPQTSCFIKAKEL